MAANQYRDSLMRDILLRTRRSQHVHPPDRANSFSIAVCLCLNFIPHSLGVTPGLFFFGIGITNQKALSDSKLQTSAGWLTWELFWHCVMKKPVKHVWLVKQLHLKGEKKKQNKLNKALIELGEAALTFFSYSV